MSRRGGGDGNWLKDLAIDVVTTPILFLVLLIALFGTLGEAPIFVLVTVVGTAAVLVFRRRRRRRSS